MSRGEPQVLDHEYDGIREYDNPTPGWWHAILIGTFVFAVFYFMFFHMSPVSWTIQEDWEKDQQADYAKVFGAVGELKPDQATLLDMMSKPKFMALSRNIFLGNCAQCHNRDGGGLPGSGVNLCDDYYKNVRKIEDIYRVITEGANNGAMPTWRNRLSNNERVIVAAYIASLRGTTPAAGKAPEGEIIPPWPKPTSGGAPPESGK